MITLSEIKTRQSSLKSFHTHISHLTSYSYYLKTIRFTTEKLFVFKVLNVFFYRSGKLSFNRHSLTLGLDLKLKCQSRIWLKCIQEVLFIVSTNIYQLFIGSYSCITIPLLLIRVVLIILLVFLYKCLHIILYVGPMYIYANIYLT